MLWKYIAAPVVGAVIGYATNWIAVKMLFRPHHEVRVFGKRLPFTPGVIPKGQGRLARAVGRAVEEQLLTKEVLENVLLSEKMKRKVKDAVTQWLMKQQESEKTLREGACGLIPEEKFNHVVSSVEERITDVVCNKIQEMNLGGLVAEKVLEAAKEKLAESMFGMMLGGSMLDPIAKMVEEKINEFLQNNAHDYVEKMISEEAEKLQNKTVGEAADMVVGSELDVPALAVSLYGSLVSEQLPRALQALNLSGIVEDRINAMDVAEVEELLLSIMKKELGTIVNLGALIGFVLGLVNVFIMWI